MKLTLLQITSSLLKNICTKIRILLLEVSGAGAIFSGKSKVLEVLEKGMSLIHGIETSAKVQQLKLNPESIPSDQLYDKLDPSTIC